LNSYKLNIADLTYSVRTFEKNLILKPEIGYENFIINKINAKVDVRVKIKIGRPNTENYKLIFDVPDSIEGNKLWTISGNGKNYFLHTIFQNENKEEVFAFFDDNFNKWEIFINVDKNEITEVDPFSYPLGPIIMLYATLVNNGIMIHSSGVKHKDKSYIFSGFSGIGKTTISDIFKNEGAERINDDRLIIREMDGKYIVYNTPMFYSDIKKQMTLDKIFLLAQAKENSYLRLNGAMAISRFSAFCMQHNFHDKLIKNQLSFVIKMHLDIPIGVLSFKPDNEIVQFVDTL